MRDVLLGIWNILLLALVVYIVFTWGAKYRLEKEKKHNIICAMSGMITVHCLISAEYALGLKAFWHSCLIDLCGCLFITFLLYEVMTIGRMYIINWRTFRGTKKGIEKWKKEMAEKEAYFLTVIRGMRPFR